MKLKNILIVVSDIERSRKFYHELFGLNVAADLGGKMILTEGLVLQQKEIWDTLIGRTSVCGGDDTELYFEENNIDTFIRKLEAYQEPVRYLNPLAEDDRGRRVIRIYDPDGHVIEVGEAFHNCLHMR